MFLRTLVESLTRPVKQLILLMVDVALAALSVLFTVLVAEGGGFSNLSALEIAELCVVAGLTAALVAYLLGVPKIKLKSYEGLGALKSTLVGMSTAVSLRVADYFLGFGHSSQTMIFFALTFIIAMILTRFLMLQLLLTVLRIGKVRRNVLIYGAGTTGTQLAAALRSHDSIRVVAFLDDSPMMKGATVMGLKVYHPSALNRLAKKHDAERVLLAMPSASSARQGSIARQLMEKGFEVHALPSFAQLVGTEILADSLQRVTASRFLNRPAVTDLHPDAENAYHGRCILVTGAGGSVGSELCRELIKYAPRKLILFEVSEVALYQIDKELSERADAKEIEIVPLLGSVTEYRQARAVCAQHGVEVVLHAAAYKHVPLVEANPLAGIVNNVLGTRTMAEAALQLGVRRFIMISTDKAVRPTNVMGASKRMAELMVQDLAQRSETTDFSIVRFGNVLGSSGSVIPLFREQIARGGPITLTHEDVTRYFMTISEAARLVLIAGGLPHDRNDGSGDLFVLDMGQPIKIRDLAVRMIEAAGCTLKDGNNPDGEIEIVVTGLRPGEKLHEELLIESGMLTTPHEKILRARERGLSSLQISAALRELRSAVATGSSDAAFDVLEDYVEGYAEIRSGGKERALLSNH